MRHEFGTKVEVKTVAAALVEICLDCEEDQEAFGRMLETVGLAMEWQSPSDHLKASVHS